MKNLALETMIDSYYVEIIPVTEEGSLDIIF